MENIINQMENLVLKNVEGWKTDFYDYDLPNLTHKNYKKSLWGLRKNGTHLIGLFYEDTFNKDIGLKDIFKHQIDTINFYKNNNISINWFVIDIDKLRLEPIKVEKAIEILAKYQEKAMILANENYKKAYSLWVDGKRNFPEPYEFGLCLK